MLRSYTRSSKKQRLAGDGKEAYEERAGTKDAAAALVPSSGGRGRAEGRVSKGAASSRQRVGGKGTKGGRGGG